VDGRRRRRRRYPEVVGPRRPRATGGRPAPASRGTISIPRRRRRRPRYSKGADDDHRHRTGLVVVVVVVAVDTAVVLRGGWKNMEAGAGGKRHLRQGEGGSDGAMARGRRRRR